tara:strand:+ start:1189 stop:1407 length:219 start_codon:yes stop_codon:yes gene_type:complete
MERQMQINKYTESLPNMEVPQLPVSLLQHMEQLGLLPKSHEDDGVNNLDMLWRNEANYFRRDVLDERGEPLF